MVQNIQTQKVFWMRFHHGFRSFPAQKRIDTGHPGRAAVENIRDTGSALFYTMEGGQITVTRLKKNELAVQKFLLPDKRFVFVR